MAYQIIEGKKVYSGNYYRNTYRNRNGEWVVYLGPHLNSGNTVSLKSATPGGWYAYRKGNDYGGRHLRVWQERVTPVFATKEEAQAASLKITDKWDGIILDQAPVKFILDE